VLAEVVIERRPRAVDGGPRRINAVAERLELVSRANADALLKNFPRPVEGRSGLSVFGFKPCSFVAVHIT
jgi:hypothetical protein